MARAGVFSWVVLLTAVAVCLCDDVGPKGDAPAPGGTLLRLYLLDGSIVTGRLAKGQLKVATGAGSRLVAAREVVGFSLGLDSRPELAKRVNDLVKALGAGNWQRRERAQAELTRIGPWLRPILQEFAGDPDLERRMRIKAVLAAFDARKDQHGGAPAPARRLARRHSEVRTLSGKILGRIVSRQLTIHSPYGELTVEVARIHEATKGSPWAPPAAKKVEVAADVQKGARVVGAPKFTRIRLGTRFGKVVIPLTSVAAVTLPEAGKPAEVELRNGDRLTGQPQWQELKIQTKKGEVTVALAALRGLAVYTGDLRDCLVFHWSFDGKDAKDAVSGIEGAVSAAVVFEKGILGQAPVFRSSKTRILIESPKWNMNGWKQVTLSAWVKMKSYSTYGNVLSRAAGRQPCGLGIRVGGNYGRWVRGLFYVRFSKTEHQGVIPATFRKNLKPYPTKNVWFHLVGTYDGTRVRFYVNGKLDGEAKVETPGRAIWDLPNGRTVIGRAASSAYDSWRDTYFPGPIDEVMIWKRALAEAEVKRLYDDTLAKAKALERQGD